MLGFMLCVHAYVLLTRQGNPCWPLRRMLLRGQPHHCLQQGNRYLRSVLNQSCLTVLYRT